MKTLTEIGLLPTPGMINRDFNSILELMQAFPDEQSCIIHLEALRWDGYVISPFDPLSKVYKCKNNRYRCANTGKYFNVKTRTLFDNTKVPLQKWFLAIWLVTRHKKGVSSLQLARDIDVTQKTAWFMLQRIRKCFGMVERKGKLNARKVDNVQAPSLTKEINQLKDLLKQCIPAVKFAKDEGLAYMINKALNGESEGK